MNNLANANSPGLSKFLKLFALLLLLSPGFVKAATAVTIESNEGLPFKKEVFGVHGEMLWGIDRVGSKELVNLYDDLGFKSIRLPGGTPANFYLWRTPKFGCREQVSKQNQERIDAFNRALNVKNRTYTVEDFASFLLATKTEFSYVINVLCDTPAETLALMAQFKRLGVSVKRVEMGNELYWQSYFDGEDAAHTYIDRSRRHSAAVRKIFPKAKVGVVASPLSYRALNFVEKSRDKASMRKTGGFHQGLEFDEKSSAATFSSALVAHLYSTFDFKADGLFSKGTNNEDIYNGAVSHFDAKIDETLSYLGGMNPEKELWITEWGITFWEDTRHLAKHFEPSHFNSLYIVNAYITFLLSSNVTFTNYHHLNVFNPAFEPGAKHISPYHAVKMLSQALDGDNVKIFPLKLSPPLMYKSSNSDYKGFYASISGIFIKSMKGQYMLLLNKIKDQNAVNLGDLCDAARGRACELQQLKSNGKIKPREDYELLNSDLKSGRLTLPGFSLNLVRVRRAPIVRPTAPIQPSVE